MKQPFYGWKLIAAVWAILAFTSGFTVYGGSVINTNMINAMQLDRKSLGIIGGSFALCMGLFSPLVGIIVNKWGAKKAFTAGSLIVLLGAVALATIIDSVIGAAIAYGFAVGCGTTLCGIVPAQTVVGFWFRKKVALALTIMTTGAVAGGFIATPIIAKVIVASNGNWRMGWFVVAAVSSISFICAILFVRNKPADIGQVQDGVVDDGAASDAKAGMQAVSSGVYKTTEDWTFKNAIRHPVLWMMLFGLSFATIASGMMVAHGVANFKDLGHSAEMAAMSLSIVVVSSLIGKGIFAVLGDRIEPRFLWSVALICTALGLAVSVKATSAIELYATAFLLGVGPSVSIISMFTLAVNYFGKTAYPTIMGVTGLFLALVPAAAIVLTGVVFDNSGSYAPAFYSAAVLCILGSMLTIFAIPPKLRLNPA